jgi:hypothetical protein
MKHLKTLNILNKCFAVLYLLGGLFGLYLSTKAAGASPLLALVPVFASAVTLGMAAIMWMLGNKLMLGQWKTGQIILAVLCLPMFPVGTAYSAYALWVTLKSEEATGAYDEMSKMDLYA